MSQERNNIKTSLLEQLRLKGADIDVYIDLVDKYLELWDIDNMLDEDIKTRGIVITEQNAKGQPVLKGNQSLKDRVAINRQMLAIIATFGLKTDEVKKAVSNKDRL